MKRCSGKKQRFSLADPLSYIKALDKILKIRYNDSIEKFYTGGEKMFKNILIGVILLTLVVGVVACGGAKVAPTPTPNDSTSTATPEKPKQEKQEAISVAVFIQNTVTGKFRKNKYGDWEPELTGKYHKGQEVTVFGEIDWYNTAYAEQTRVYLTEDTTELAKWYTVEAIFNEPNNPYGFKEGQVIVVKGEFDRVYSNVEGRIRILLKNCTLVKVLQ
jgi:hypothetical protein